MNLQEMYTIALSYFLKKFTINLNKDKNLKFQVIKLKDKMASSISNTLFPILENLNTFCNNASEKLVPQIKKICSVAFVILGGFSAYTSPKIFTAFFIAGFVMGVSAHFSEKDIKLHKGRHHKSGCVDGFLNEISNVKLPASIVVVSNFFITLVHIDHHATVYVPLTGLYCGAVFGKYVTAFLDENKTSIHKK
jgi:hypothetical protein